MKDSLFFASFRIFTPRAKIIDLKIIFLISVNNSKFLTSNFYFLTYLHFLQSHQYIGRKNPPHYVGPLPVRAQCFCLPIY